MDEKRLIEIIADQLNVPAEEITPESSFVEDLMADSLDQVEIVVAIEDELGVKIPDEYLSSLHTVNDALEMLKKLG